MKTWHKHTLQTSVTTQKTDITKSKALLQVLGCFLHFFYRRHAVKDQVLGAFSGSHFYSFKFLKCSILEKQTFQSLFISISGSDSLVLTHYLVLLSECHNLLKTHTKPNMWAWKKSLCCPTQNITNNVRLIMLMTWNIHKMFYIKGNNVSYSAGQHHILVSIIFPLSSYFYLNSKHLNSSCFSARSMSTKYQTVSIVCLSLKCSEEKEKKMN